MHSLIRRGHKLATDIMGNSVTPLQAAKEASREELSVYAGGPFWSEKFDGEAIIRYAPRGPASKAMNPAITVVELLTMAARKRPVKPALQQEPPALTALIDGKKAPPPVPREQWRIWTWADYLKDVRRAARSMISLGFLQHDACTIFGFNSPEWMIGCVGAMFAGGKASGVYPSDTAEQFQYKCHHSRSSIVIVESLEHLELVKKVLPDLPYLKAIVVWAAAPKEENIGDVKIMFWEEFLARSDRVKDSELDARTAMIHPGHPCSLIYTSGTSKSRKQISKLTSC